MAKWGKGDPRWIVEERADATNVNNWHWTEKNANAWSKDKLRSLLQGLKIKDDKYVVEIKELTKLDGEASANNRKGKLIFFYEWDLKADWKGKVEGGDKYHKGTIAIPNLSDERTVDEIDINVTANDDKDSAAYELKEFVRTKGPEVIREKLANYIKELKEEFSQGMILPAKDATNEKKPDVQRETANTAKEKLSKLELGKEEKKVSGVKIHCKKIKDKVEFKCQAGDIYKALTEKQMVSAFTRGEASIQAEKGGRFAMFAGNVTGEFKNLEPFKTIEMKWRYKGWPVEHYSNVTISLDEKEDCTELSLTQTGVPESDYDRTREGWKNYYWESIKQTFGFGARLF